MIYHLLLHQIHAQAPGSLNTLFSADGAFEGAPRFRGPLYDLRRSAFATLGEDVDPADLAPWFALDLRMPTVAAHVAGVCWRSTLARRCLLARDELATIYRAQLSGTDPWTDEDAGRLCALVLSLAAELAGKST